MTISREYLQHVLEMLEPLGGVTSRRMFGGAGIYRDGTMFGLIADDVLYLRTDDANRPDFEAEGAAPFVPFEDGRMVMPYHQAPDSALEDPDELRPWAESAWEAARRAQAAKPRKKKKT